MCRGGDWDVHESLDEVYVGFRMTRDTLRRKSTVPGNCQWQEQLVGQVFTHGGRAPAVALPLLHGVIGHRLGRPAYLTESGKTSVT